MQHITLGKLHSEMLGSFMHNSTKEVICPTCNSVIKFNMKHFMDGYVQCNTCTYNNNAKVCFVDIPSDDRVTYITSKGVKGVRHE